MSELGTIGPDFPPDGNFKVGWRGIVWIVLGLLAVLAVGYVATEALSK